MKISLLKMPTYFISGHGNLTQAEFEAHYVPQLSQALALDGRFVVGDFRGADSLAQMWLSKTTTPTIVYHCFTQPRNNFGNHPTHGGFQSDEERDCAMTADSDFDILWIRYDKSNRISGTEKNKLRREKIANQ